MKVVTDPGIISPEAFIAEVINERLPNPYIPDTPQRIATDTSLKIPIRFGETIKSYIFDPDLDVTSLDLIPLVIAAWLRYLIATDDNGDPMEVSSDPMLPTLQEYLADVKWNDPASLGDKADPILRNDLIFASDLMACGLGDKIKEYLSSMLQGEGYVRKTLSAAVDG